MQQGTLKHTSFDKLDVWTPEKIYMHSLVGNA